MPNNAPISIWQVKYAERVVRKKDVFHDYEQYGIPDGPLDMDYNFWVLRTGDKTVLVDTGYDISEKDWLGEISVTPPPVGLEKVGVDPTTVDMVITSHFHYDHIGYLRLFTNATVVSGQAEMTTGSASGRTTSSRGVHRGAALEAVKAKSAP